ncbi:MAG TPA: ABC transporter ATP-binding protein [Clostridiaceae bacterium]|jgi:ABC-2 type transport system ATP-binding protein|nr:ABC transporter ATP-binding protein [Clostridiaceae bacterium]
MQIIKVCDVSKNYRDVLALNEINLELKAGTIYGLLGRNGAGKSTLLKVIADRIKPTNGRILYDGEARLDDVTSRELYFSEPEKMMPDLIKVKELCYYTSQFYPRFNLEESLRVLKDFGVNEKKRLNQLSTGQFAIVRSVVALQTRASFIFLDEPTLGHDAVNRELLYNEILRIYREEENTIVLSTHLIDEISNLLEEVIFIDRGQIVLEESLEDILDAHTYLIGPSEDVRQIEDAYTVIEKKVDLGFTSLLVKHSSDTTVLPPGIKVSQAGLQDIFIAYSMKFNK